MGERKHISLKVFGKQLLKRFNEDGALDIAAQLAYYFLFSLFPFLIFTFTLIPYIGITQEQILPLINRYAPPELMNIIRENLDRVLVPRSGGLISFSVVATLWPASNALNALMRALNRSYEVTETRSFFVTRGMSILLTFGMILVIIVALGLNVFGHVIGKFVFSHLGLSHSFVTFWTFTRLLLSFIIITTVFACLYYFAPNRRFPFNEIIFGALFASVGWQVVSLAFSYYVDQLFNQFSATYGTLGGIVVLMVWFYITALIIIIGGEINATTRYFKLKLYGSKT